MPATASKALSKLLGLQEKTAERTAITTCFPLAITQDQIGSSSATDYNPSIPVTYINPSTGVQSEIVAEFDSGSFISIAPSSLATILGLNLTDGDTIQLQGVGGTIVDAYVHSINIQIGADLYQGISVAIAGNENIPFLIGRVNFWDYATISIDNTMRQICFTQLSSGTAPPSQTSPPAAAAAPSADPTGTVITLVAGGLVAAAALYCLGEKAKGKGRRKEWDWEI
jgi:hypothetical protein